MAEAFSLGEAVLGTSVDLDGLNRGLDKAERASRSGVDKIGGVLAGVGRAVATGLAAATVAVAGLGVALTDLAIDAAPVQGIIDGFEAIADAADISADDMLDALERGSGGLIAQRDLMKSFNLATQLVSDQFAQQLPEAMESLRKVAASTGEDMGFLLDSLVRGVGRVSPLILDNLGIQVDLVAANEAYAESIGVSVDELTKAQEQTALMNQVLGLLAENTAALPDVTGTAAEGIASLGATMQNLRDTLGIALQPAFTEMLGTINALIEQGLPPFVEFFENDVIPIIETVTGVVSEFIEGIIAGQEPTEALQNALDGVIPQDTIDDIIELIDQSLLLIEAFLGLFDTIGELGTEGTNFIEILNFFIEAAGATIEVIDAMIFVVDLLIEALETAWLGFQALFGPIDELGARLDAIILPDWLTPGSPTPLETGLLGIAEQMRALSLSEIPQLTAALNLGAAGAGNITTDNSTTNLNWTVVNPVSVETNRQDFAAMRAMIGDT
jgi:hypothetical protein